VPDKHGINPSKFQTRGDLLIGYGDERILRVETQECVRQIMRLIDFQNAGVGLPEPFNVGGNRLSALTPESPCSFWQPSFSAPLSLRSMSGLIILSRDFMGAGKRARTASRANSGVGTAVGP
jgi:hypothetical protein